MKIYIKKIIFGFLLSMFFANVLYAQMSDKQVTDYITKANANGTSKEEIATSLMKKGVTRDQLERIKTQYENDQITNAGNAKTDVPVRREKVSQDDFTTGDLEDIKDEEQQLLQKVKIFGHDIFQTKNLSFAPSTNIPTPADYRLGPGDEIIINIWGASQKTFREVISPEGSIIVDRLGPVYLNGKTIKEANDYINKQFTNIFSTIADSDSEIQLTLGQIRTIQINVMGEAMYPGTYALSSLSSVFHALYKAGGVKTSGSLRSIKLIRNGKELKILDVYKYILDGKTNDDIRLTDNDVVSVLPYSSLVSIVGNVKRPMSYEMTENETVADLIRYAGDFTGDAYRDKIRLTRTTGEKNHIFTISKDEYASFVLKDKDIIDISNGIDLYENRVEIRGAVFRNGYYETGKNINTVKDLIEAADGLRGDALLSRAVIIREKDDFTHEVMALNLERILSGADNVPLLKNDILSVFSVNDLYEYGDFVIYGAVSRPGSYKYADNTSLEDLIVQAGGLLESASTVQVDVARRINDPKSTTTTNRLSENYILTVKDGYLVDGDRGFILKPYDAVYVRRSPGYQPQRNVHISGEVLFPGTYALNKKTERLSDIIKRAKGLTLDAFPQGARLVRHRSGEDAFRSLTALKMARQGGKDSISTQTLDLAPEYSIGIELERALAQPGSDCDLVLREGDKLFIPEFDNTVKIDGAVMYPNTVVYDSQKKLSYYIEQAGGYSDFAKKSKVFVIYMNGTVKKVKKYNVNSIQPGCEIIVPSRDRAKKLTVQEVVGVGVSITPIVSLIGVLTMLLKK